MAQTAASQRPEPFFKTLDHPVQLPVFEGPLDLLLFLIRKNEVDIYDIPIAKITRQYIDVLHGMEQLNLEAAGEFFVMAATLMHIKSRLLLPKKEQLPEEEEEEADEHDPRWELVQQLIEYKRFKEAASGIAALAEEQAGRLPRIVRPEEEPPARRPLKNSGKIELWNTFNHVLRRLAEKLTTGQIHAETVSVAARMEFILEQLKTRRRFLFSSLFEPGSRTLPVLVATFLAVLELARLRQINLEQTGDFSDIVCSAAENGPPESFISPAGKADGPPAG